MCLLKLKVVLPFEVTGMTLHLYMFVNVYGEMKGWRLKNNGLQINLPLIHSLSMLMRYLWDRVEGIYAQLENVWDYRGVWWIGSSQPLKLYIDRSEVEHWHHGGQEKELQLSVPRAGNREIKNGLKVGLYLDWIPALPLTNYMASAPSLNLSNTQLFLRVHEGSSTYIAKLLKHIALAIQWLLRKGWLLYSIPSRLSTRFPPHLPHQYTFVLSFSGRQEVDIFLSNLLCLPISVVRLGLCLLK